MIVRSYFACRTCEQPHVVRIGLGNDVYQSHSFACTQCGEEMVIGIKLDLEQVSWELIAKNNCNEISGHDDAPVVNVDGMGPIPLDKVHEDGSFFRLERTQQYFEKAEEFGSLVDMKDVPEAHRGERPFRPADYSAEWQLLRRTWSLKRRNQNKLASKFLGQASNTFYRSDPLKSLDDWVFRFAAFFTNPLYEKIFADLAFYFKRIGQTSEIETMLVFYQAYLRQERATNYFDILSEYFRNAAEFYQVYYGVAKGIEFDPTYRTGSSAFDSVRMFYGNCFETFASHVDILAYLNNIASGRQFDHFEQLDRASYLKLDKASRFNPFLNNPIFANLCEERDNKLRNASHHRSMVFDPASQQITYRSGRGENPQLQTIYYVEYLQKSVKLFLQTLTLLRFEILLCYIYGKRPPI